MTSSYLLLNSLRFHYLYWNLETAGRPIVLHHGLASTAHIWDFTAPLLADAGYALYAPDARGHGLTDKPDTGYDIDTITSDLAALIDACRLERPVLCGHSWGASVILNYARRYAVGPRAPSAIVLVDGGIGRLSDSGLTWEEMEHRLKPPPLAGTLLDEFRRGLKAWSRDWAPSDPVLETYLHIFDVSEDDRIYPRLTLERHMRIVRSLWDFNPHQAYSMLRCPVLMIPARMDAAGEENAHAAAIERGLEHARQSIRDLRIQRMENTVHDAPLHRPALLAEIVLGFLREFFPEG